VAESPSPGPVPVSLTQDAIAPSFRVLARPGVIKPRYVWADDDGDVCGAMRLGGGAEIQFYSPAQARAFAAEALGIAEDMDAEIARVEAARERSDG